MPAGRSLVAQVKKSPANRDAAWVGQLQFTDEYKDHPLSDLFPAMEGTDYTALVEDIRKHGLRQPVILCEGKILDGRHRYHACLDAGTDCWFETYDGDDPLGYVVSLNLKRRHLDTSQRAMVAAKLATLKQGQKADTAIAVSQQAAAKSLNVSVDSVQRARKVRAKGTAALQGAVEQGKIAVSKAAEIADLPKREQGKAIQALRRGRLTGGKGRPATTEDIFADLKFEGSILAKERFDSIIKTAIAVIGELDKIIADAIWSLKLSDRKKAKAGLKKYSNEIERLPGRIKKLLAAGAAADKTKAG